VAEPPYRDGPPRPHPSDEPHPLGQALVELGLVNERQLAQLLAETDEQNRLGKLIVDRGIVTEDRLIAQLSKHLGIETIEPESTPVHDRVLKLVPAELARKHRIIPIARRKEKGQESLFLATAEPFDPDVEQALNELIPGVSLKYFLASEAEISAGLSRHYGRGNSNGSAKVRVGGSAAVEVAPAAPMDMSESETQVAPERIGKYDLLERIGVDATAELFLTDQSTSDGRRLVLRRPLPKVPKNEKTRKKFFGDAEKCIGLKHLNIVEVHEVASRGMQWYVVQEHVDGVDLARLFQKARKLKVRMPERAALFVASKVVDGIDYAYSTRDESGQPLKLLHHGLSPASVLVSEEGHVKVHGFGLEDAAVAQRSHHAAPEQIEGGNVDERTIVFRAGLIVYELLAGSPLFEERASPEAMEKVLSGVSKTFRQHCPDASPELEKVLVKMLAVDRGQRPTMREVGETLDGVLGGDVNQRAPTELGRYVRGVLGNPEDSRDFPRAREDSLVPAPLRDAGEKVEKLVAPGIKKSGETMANGLERFGAWFAAAPRSQQLATILIPIAIILGTAIGVVTRTGKTAPPPVPIEVDTGHDEAVAAIEPPLPDEAPTEVVQETGKGKEMLPGIYDVPAPEGSSYVAIEGAELRSTNEDDGEVLLWLDAGRIVEKIRPAGQRMMVMVPPKGPVGFIAGNALSTAKPLEVLGKEMGFKACKVDARRSLDDCLVKGKEQTDTCNVRCKEKASAGSRCLQACQAAFDRCARQCNDSKAVFDREQEKRAQQRPRKRKR
jgi:serine/threonine protein kinase